MCVRLSVRHECHYSLTCPYFRSNPSRRARAAGVGAGLAPHLFLGSAFLWFRPPPQALEVRRAQLQVAALELRFAGLVACATAPAAFPRARHAAPARAAARRLRARGDEGHVLEVFREQARRVLLGELEELCEGAQSCGRLGLGESARWERGLDHGPPRARPRARVTALSACKASAAKASPFVFNPTSNGLTSSSPSLGFIQEGGFLRCQCLRASRQRVWPTYWREVPHWVL